ncbi:alanine--tRNA ligase [Deinococcus deserti]|uniref:Alanine--tRNA ligase n=1 Tax=Deinococcus deserti (strain DSM 17065 / CIP 109153 / LMG 22923 / VCD115) TaxID=546414 RepID=C1CXW8_DEIDV|nr:alanine--tRNA ligase [Deinococcus deserti]ACO46924.1 putative alanine--tRNA ligase (Alanyl-tRNA synthetase) [Deinococcus deserti VCD115]
MTAPLTTSQIREKFLQFFESKGHLRLPSHSTIAPDPTTLFTVAGMQPFKDQFMGAPAVFDGVANKRVTTAQKCVRVPDIENVGRTRRHLTLFEMMGNFSFGDYFKRDAILWAWDFLTGPEWMGMDPDKMYVTIYKDDDEAFGYWTQEVGLDASHIHRFDADENFWPANAPLEGPNGPCGPCSEIYYDRGSNYGDDTWADYAQTRESARFLEVWNLVFPQYDRQDPAEDGTPVLKDLPFKNIDTGMGLERVASVVQDVPDFYSNDVFRPIVDKVAELSGKPYEGEISVSHRVVAEHMRSVCMILADGTALSNTGRGYTLRKILRRASRHAYLLGMREPALYQIAPVVAAGMGDAYPELRTEQGRVEAAIRAEEERFLKTLEGGIQRLGSLLSGMPQGGTLSGEEAFVLYDTYGFPLDLTKEIAEEYGISVDEARYAESLENAQNIARAGSKYGKSELFGGNQEALEGLSATEFVGFDHLEAEGQVLALVGAGERLSHLSAGSEATVVLSRTPFYGEGGGEVGDTGRLEWEGGAGMVRDTRKTPAGVFLHDVLVEQGELTEGVTVRGVVGPERQAIQRHHTATHLLHAALRAVLGSGVRQAGSLVAADRLRFDFSHGAALSAEELSRVETLVSRWISANFPVTWQEMPIAEAKAAGATALFGEKYGEKVRVVSVEGDVEYGGQPVSSKELCGGAHVRRTGDIGAFVLLSDENVAAGVRRIEALAGEAATSWVRERLNGTARVAALLNTSPDGLEARVTGLQAQLKAAEKEVAAVKRQLAQAQMGSSSGGGAQTRELGGFRVAALKLSGIEGNELRGAADKLLDQSGADLVVLASDKGLVVKASKDAVTRGAHAGQLVGKLAAAGGGKGGGRPDMAQAGITDPVAALNALDTAF